MMRVDDHGGSRDGESSSAKMEPMKMDDRAKLSEGEASQCADRLSRLRSYCIVSFLVSAVVLSATFIALYLTRDVGEQHDVKPTLLSSSLNSNMVLQRDVPNEIFGWSTAPGAAISVDFNGTASYSSVASSTADAEIYTHDSVNLYYRWSITLPPVPVTTFPSYLKVTSSISEAAFAEDILFGDVYICSGQSNMQMPAIFMFDYDDAVSQLPSSTNNRLRIFTVSQDDTQYYNGKPSGVFATVTLDWVSATAESVSSAGRGGFFGWSQFSAVCLSFGLEIIRSQPLNGEIPIGLIAASWGGTMIEGWLPTESIERCYDEHSSPSRRVVANPFDKPATTNGMPQSYMYNTMLHPLRHTATKGQVWYQGESNVFSLTSPALYNCMLTSLVRTFRSFSSSSLSTFLHVQLSDWFITSDSLLPSYRLLSNVFCDGYDGASPIPNCGFASAADLGDPTSPYGDIHPRPKLEIGRRLARACRDVCYGDGGAKAVDGSWKGPEIESVVVEGGEGGSDAVVTVTFEQDSVGGGGIQIKDEQACPDPSVCEGFAVVLENGDRIDVDADAVTVASPTSIVIKLPASTFSSGSKLKTLQMGQSGYPLIQVFNAGDFPLLPFVVDV